MTSRSVWGLKSRGFISCCFSLLRETVASSKNFGSLLNSGFTKAIDKGQS